MASTPTEAQTERNAWTLVFFFFEILESCCKFTKCNQVVEWEEGVAINALPRLGRVHILRATNLRALKIVPNLTLNGWALSWSIVRGAFAPPSGRARNCGKVSLVSPGVARTIRLAKCCQTPFSFAARGVRRRLVDEAIPHMLRFRRGT